MRFKVLTNQNDYSTLLGNITEINFLKSHCQILEYEHLCQNLITNHRAHIYT